MSKESYTSASVYIPTKLMHTKVTDKKNRIIPKHVCFLPTNRCNANCKICFCCNRDKTLELDFNKAKKVVNLLKKMGTEAISLSGGGDPLMYSHINKLIQYIKKKGLDVGLTTNGLALRVLETKSLNCLTWCRISVTPDRKYDFKVLQKVIDRGKKVDWNFSYVVSNEKKFVLVTNIIKFANKNNFTHIRIVGDMMDKKNQLNLKRLKSYLNKKRIKKELIIWQDRQFYTSGVKNCWLSLLRPIVGPDGNVYPCCGIHYATDPPVLDFNKTNMMCKIEDYPDIIKKQKCFNGSNCKRCDYGSYNKVLDAIKAKVKHKKFL